MNKPFVLTRRGEEILKTIHFYRYMTALDVAHLFFSPSSLTHVREILSSLAGRGDFRINQYLYRFALPHISAGNTEKIYTLGNRGREFLEKEVGLEVNWYFRPEKVRHLSYGQILHSLVLTRFLVAASAWCKKQAELKLSKVRISYELAGTSASVQIAQEGKLGAYKVIPDGWLLFEKMKNGEHEHWYPVLLEIDRGMEYQHKFKQHVRSRIEFIKKGGLYSKMFATEAVMVAYVTTSETLEYRETRRRAMCAWTQQVLAELHKENWASVFRFYTLPFDGVYDTPVFQAPVWYRPDSSSPVPLFTG